MDTINYQAAIDRLIFDEFEHISKFEDAAIVRVYNKEAGIIIDFYNHLMNNRIELKKISKTGFVNQVKYPNTISDLCGLGLKLKER